MNNRRDFLKYFGVGATIVPIVAGTLKTDAAATLIEVPKVDIVAAQSVPWFPMRPFINKEKLRIQVHFSDARGNVSVWDAETFLTSMDRIDITSWDDAPYRKYIAGPQMRWEMKGIFTGEVLSSEEETYQLRALKTAKS